MKNTIKDKMQEGEAVIGTFFNLGGSTAVECLGIAGLDFLIIDAEHGPFDVESTMDFVRAAERRGITPLVRAKDHARSSILKMLDIGARGLIVPYIETVEQVQQLVEYSKYYPIGKRGFGYGRGVSFGHEDFTDSMENFFNTCNDKTLLLPQCETVGCLNNIEEIVGMEGVDGIFVGPYDLSIDMGLPGQFDHPEMVAALARIMKACKQAGKLIFIYAADNVTAKKYLAEGYDAVTIGMDAMVYIKAFQNLLADVKAP